MLSDININNISYNWNDIEIHFAGLNVDPTGVSSINYSTDHNVEFAYSRQGLPVARQFGRYEVRATIELDYYEMLKLRHNLKVNPLLVFDVKVVYKGNDLRHTKIHGEDQIIRYDNHTFIDTLYGCRISSPDVLGGEQGEMNLRSSIELNPVWIKYGGRLLDLV